VDSNKLLTAEGLRAGYGPIRVVPNLDLEVAAGEVVALVGANGAGKTTTLLTLAGAIPAQGGKTTYQGATVTSPLHMRARHGLSLVTEERSVFMGLTTAENLRLGRGDQQAALELFPELLPRMKVKAGLLSGGEQQMLTLARALSRRPKLLLADELSLGLAPIIVDRLLRAVREAADTMGVGVLLVEQHIQKALTVADRGYVMRRGEIVLSGTAEHLRTRLDTIEEAYLAAEIQGEDEADTT
jgi:branched-chain amino acid transport system ATP-binding protein